MWWTTLAHVCRRWRAIVLASPQRLHLRVLCGPRTPVKTSLDIWPPFPIAVHGIHPHTTDEEGENNLVAALGHRDRISDIHIFDPDGSSMERLVVAMQEPLPALTDIYLCTVHNESLVLPDAFLGGHAPRLRRFTLQRVSFPAFPKFVLHATHIVVLSLSVIPDSWYTSVSPEAMATCLAALPDLETLTIAFRSPHSSLLRTTLLPQMRSVLPSLTSFRFRGVSEYLEGVISQIDTPRLDKLRIEFFMDLIFHIPQLHRFIGRTRRLRTLDPARLQFDSSGVMIFLGSSPTCLDFEIICEEPDWQLSSVTQVCNEHFPLLSQVERLSISDTPFLELAGKNKVDSSQWLELFRPFSAVRSLRVLSETLEPLVAAALGELTGDRTMEVLPVLENISLDELEPSRPAWDAMESFIAARQLSGRPVVVQRQKGRSRPKTDTPHALKDEL